MKRLNLRHGALIGGLVLGIFLAAPHAGFAADKPKPATTAHKAKQAAKPPAAPEEGKPAAEGQTAAAKAGKAPLLPGSAAFKSDAPLHIASDRMEVNQADRTILFEGHVVVQQDDLTITGNRMKVFETGPGEKEAAPKVQPAAAGSPAGDEGQPSMMNKIDHIEVEGDVHISQQDKIATSEKAIYYHKEQKIVLLGNPSVAQGKDTVTGRLITLFVADGRSVVEGGEQRPVQVVLHPKDKE